MEKVSIKTNSSHYRWGTNCDGWHLVQSENLSVIQESVPSGSFEIKHYHNSSEQFFYVIAGETILEIESEIIILKVNEGCHIPCKVRHQLRNDSLNELRFLVISTPPSHGDRVEV